MKTFSTSLRFTGIFLIVVLSYLLPFYATSQEIRADHGFSLIEQNPDYLILDYSANSINDLQKYVKEKIILPGKGCYIAVPEESEVFFEIISQTSVQTDEEGFYPVPVKISEIFKIRGVNVVLVQISPFIVDPVNNGLILLQNIRVKISFTGGNEKYCENRLRSRWWDPILKNLIINYKVLPETEYGNSSKEDGAEYLIISPDGTEFQQWAETIRNFRTLQGISSKVVTLNEIGGNSANDIENYINDAYNTWNVPPAAILLMGDYGTTASNSIISPVWSGYCVSDNIYGDVNGDDLPDIIMARMCAENATQLETMVSKVVEYETNPPVNPSFYDNPITSCLFNPGGWLQIITESVAGFYEVVLGKNTNRLNVCNGPVPAVWSTGPGGPELAEYFGPNGLGYIPATPGEVNSNWAATTQEVIDGINNGAFMMLRRGPSSETGWEDPDFSNTNIDALSNPDLTFVWAVGCLNGKFNGATECFAEKFHRHTYNGNNAGAIGVVAASEVTFSLTNDVYTMGVFDQMWPDYLPGYGSTFTMNGVYPAFANAAGKYYLHNYTWPFNPNQKKSTYHVFHYFGDAFSNIYTEMPQDLTVSHLPYLEAGVTSFEVTANDGSLIALTVNGEIIGVATGIGIPVSVPIPPQNPPDSMLITVTLHNFYRYSEMVPVVTTELQAFFTAEPTDICEGQTVSFTDQSTGIITSRNWTFEGGNPSTSSSQNPIVTYESAGYYDVTLIVSNGNTSDTLQNEDFITVRTVPAKPDQPDGEEYPYTMPGSEYDYTTAAVLWAESYEWVIDPIDAVQTMIVNDTVCTVDFTDWWDGNATIKVRAINDCGEGEFSDPLSLYLIWEDINEVEEALFTILPNPTSGNIKVEWIPAFKPDKIAIIDRLGQIVNSQNIDTNQGYSINLNLDPIQPGMYFIVLQGKDKKIVKKLILQ